MFWQSAHEFPNTLVFPVQLLLRLFSLRFTSSLTIAPPVPRISGSAHSPDPWPWASAGAGKSRSYDARRGFCYERGALALRASACPSMHYLSSRAAGKSRSYDARRGFCYERRALALRAKAGPSMHYLSSRAVVPREPLSSIFNRVDKTVTACHCF